MTKSLPSPDLETVPTAPMKIAPWRVLILAFAWPLIGFVLPPLFKLFFKIEISKLVVSLINLPIGFFGLLYLFPKVLRAPFGEVPLPQYLQRIGFYLPRGAWRHVILGMLLAGCTLSGMLVASLLTGRYVLDWSTINLSHIVFSLNPGIFEEVFFRGIIMLLLLQMTKSLPKAMLAQIAIFGVGHIKGFDLVSLVDAFSVMVIAVAFTYVAYKTRNLLAGMVFHFLHDAFLFFVQVPEKGIYIGFYENFLFYSLLWLMVGAACLLTWYATERLQIRAERELYVVPAA